jgi:hypothetical protein
MKYVYLLLFTLYFSAACKKNNDPAEDKGPIEVISIYPKIKQVINDSTIVLTWPKYTGKHFNRYLIQRSALYLKDGKVSDYYDNIDSTTDVNDTTFTETQMPAGYRIYYNLYTQNSDHYNLSSGSVQYDRPPYTLLKTQANEGVIDKQQKIIFIPQIDLNKILVVDYTTGIQINSIEANGPGYCDMGNFNGRKELYVPLYSGQISIYDAETFKFKDYINCGRGANSVVAANGKLYVNTRDTAGGVKETIQVYDRANKNLIGKTGFGNEYKLLLLKNGSSVEMIGISDFYTNHVTNLSYLQFSSAGVPVSKKQIAYSNDSLPYATTIIRAFPDGNKIITSMFGTIFNNSLGFERILQKKFDYTDYEFSDDGSLIYAADFNHRKIDVISYPDGNIVKSYTTRLFPYKIYRDNNALVSISHSWNNIHGTFLFIVEKIDL